MAKEDGLNSSLRLLTTAQAAKLGTWYVRIITPYVETWDMTSKKRDHSCQKICGTLGRSGP